MTPDLAIFWCLFTGAVAGSPIEHVAAFKAPVLMFHGTLDRNVSVEETRSMNSRLRAALHIDG